MNFWRALRWVATAVLAAVLVLALWTRNAETPSTSSTLSRPAPTILR